MASGATLFDVLGLGARTPAKAARWHRRQPQSRSEGHRTSRYLLIALLVFYAFCAIAVLGSSDPQTFALLVSPSP